MSSTVLTANREIKLQESGTTELLPTVHLFGAILGVTIMMIMILGGNGLVIWTYICERRLHKFASSLYILNIAVCDFLIGAVSVPIHFYYTVNQRVWTLGKSSCKVCRFSHCNANMYVNVNALRIIKYLWYPPKSLITTTKTKVRIQYAPILNLEYLSVTIKWVCV